jgi:hypothetical protein
MSQLTVSKTIGQVTELTLIATLKAGVAPQYKAALAAAQESPSPIFSKIATIHFARWVLFDNDTRLIFCSNFDGTLEGYLRDFSVQMPDQMDGVFGVCEGYPANGCKDFEAFQQFVSDHQVPTNLFYAAYPDVSVKNVTRAVAMKKLTDAYVRSLG